MNSETRPDIELSVVCPLYNEEAVIEHTTARLLEKLHTLDFEWELILVNDGSTDQSYEKALQAIQNDPRARIMSYAQNRGRGYALRTGIRHSRGNYVVTTESDLSWGQDVIEQLYKELIRTGADIVIASPYAKGGKLENVPFQRALLSWLGNQILKRSVPRNITMLSGMTRGYIGDFIRALPLEQDRKEIHLEIVSKACMLNCLFSEIPVTLRWEKPQAGKPKRKSKFKAGKLIRSHLLFGFYEAPILLFGTFGSLAFLGGTGIGLDLFYRYAIEKQVIGNHIVLILTTIFLILTGLLMFLFCFLSYQIKALRGEIFKLQCRKP